MAVALPIAVGDVAESFGYATMGERFLAFLCDASIEAALVGALLTGLSPTKGVEKMFAWVIPILYMTFAEFIFHGTPGKRLLGIQVREDSPELGYPSLLQLLLRESIYKFISGIALGIGFLGAGDKKKTWHDKLAGTVVVRSRMPGRLRPWMVPLLICAYFVLSFAGKVIASNYRNTLTDRVITTEGSIDRLHQKILNSFFLVLTLPEEKRHREQMRALLPALDEYDRLLDREREQVKRARWFITSGDTYETARLNAYAKASSLRQEISGLVRQHVQKVLDSGPQQPGWDALVVDRRQMMYAVNDRNDEINRIGRGYMPSIISYDKVFK